MKAIIGLLGFLVVLALLICVVGWVFSTGFLIFDILLVCVLYALPFVVGLLIIIGILWAINEIFN